MKSDVCKIYKGTADLEAIFKECEKVAVYNKLNHKQSLQLRLICEEIDGMLPNIIDDFEGDIWFEFENGVCRVNVSIQISGFDISKKEELIGLAKNGKNAAAVGIVGKIRSAIENVLLDEVAMSALTAMPDTSHLPPEVEMAMSFDHVWSLENYKSTVRKDEQAEAWDELEKSVIASVADDVIVGVKGKRADIVIIKKFA